MFKPSIHTNDHEGQGDWFWSLQWHQIVAQEIKVLLELTNQP
jgi:hypothetical protein